MTRILFLHYDNASCSHMAAAFARTRHEADIEITSAGIIDSITDPGAVEVMSEVGIDISNLQSRKLEEMDSLDFDVVIAFDQEAYRHCPILPGHPEKVDWNVPNPPRLKGKENDRLGSHRENRDLIQRLVTDLFERGYVKALAAAKCCASVILNNVSDGIIAHDMDRRIFFFNRSAEEITGYKRDDVINRDCHDVFPGKLCGGKCHFCDGTPSGEIEIRKERVEITTRSGETKYVSMTLKSLSAEGDCASGVLVSFRDQTREHYLARRVGEIEQFSGIIGRDKKMIEVYDLIRDLADTNVPVLIQGDSGTGKELVAAAIHNEGPRANKLFVPVNCGALPESLLESELFGHVKGAFTGAIRDKKGRFELADSGTIFLDEIGDISPVMQVKLLRVLQEGTFERVGSEKTVKVNVRIISATNKDLAEEIAESRFREDLYYRLNVVPLFLPPLRDRRNDIPLLVDHVLHRALADMGRDGVTVSPEALDVMMSYDWPGNVRELQNWIQFSLVKCRTKLILPEHLPPVSQGIPGTGNNETGKRRRRRKLDIETVQAALRKSQGNKVEAARLLGVSRATLYRFLDDVGLGL